MRGLLDRFLDWMDKPRGLFGHIRQGDVDAVKKDVDNGYPVNVAIGGRTPLMAAALEGSVDIVRLFLERGANINPAVIWDWDSFRYAVSGFNPEVIRIFLDNGAFVDARDPKYEITGLMVAAEHGNLEVAKLLLEHGADPALEDHHGDTAYRLARRAGHAEVARLIQSYRKGGPPPEQG